MRWNRLKSEKERKRRISFQRGTQLIAAALMNGYVVGFVNGRLFAGKSKTICVPGLNCYSCPGAFGACPLGALQTALGAKREFPFYVLGCMTLFGVFLGRLVCGFLCPFGLVQDLLHKIPVPKWQVRGKLDRAARYLKYVVLLAAVILLPAFLADETGLGPPYFCEYICPAGTLEGGIPQMIANPQLRQLAGALFDWKVAVLAAILIWSMVLPRPFCRYLCPLGAFYSLFNKCGFYQMRVDQAKCVDCKKCEQTCPMGVEVTKNINSPECIRCGQCRDACSVNAIKREFR